VLLLDEDAISVLENRRSRRKRLDDFGKQDWSRK